MPHSLLGFVALIALFFLGGLLTFGAIALCLAANDWKTDAPGDVPAMSSPEPGASAAAAAAALPEDPLHVVRWHPPGTLSGNARQRRIQLRCQKRRDKLAAS